MATGQTKEVLQSGGEVTGKLAACGASIILLKIASSSPAMRDNTCGPGFPAYIAELLVSLLTLLGVTDCHIRGHLTFSNHIYNHYIHTDKMYLIPTTPTWCIIFCQ